VRVELIVVPFDSGLRDRRTGRGPDRLLELGLGERLQALGAEVRVRRVEAPPGTYPTEIRMAHELQRAVSAAVSDALGKESFPLVLSGNCNVAVGVVAGIRSALGASPAVCWFDAHADFNTPESTIGGFLDGMSVAMVAGRCWRELTAQVPGYAPIPETQILMIGTRDVDPLELELLKASAIRVVASPADIRADVDAVVTSARTKDSYVHLDLDSIDTSEGNANIFAVAGGLTRSTLFDSVKTIGAHSKIRAATISAYDPECDADGRIARIAIEAAALISSSS
jgi:arginase